MCVIVFNYIDINIYVNRHAYLVVFEMAAAPAFAVVEVLGFGAVEANGRLVVATKKWKSIKIKVQKM